MCVYNTVCVKCSRLFVDFSKIQMFYCTITMNVYQHAFMVFNTFAVDERHARPKKQQYHESVFTFSPQSIEPQRLL